MPVQLQVAWEHCNLMVGGKPTSLARGELVPDTDDTEELAQRATLVLGGALRVVEVVFTQAEMAEAVQAAAETAQAAAAAQGENSQPAEVKVGGGPPVVMADKAKGRAGTTGKG